MHPVLHTPDGLQDPDIWVADHVKALGMQTRLNRLQKQLSTYQTLEVESTGLSELAGKKSVCKSRFELTTSRAGYF